MTSNAKPLNVLLITTDQQHWDTLGIDNPAIKTPVLDQMCREGTRFGRAYCPNPTCTPTRASIITGLYPSQHGAWALGTKLMESVPTVGDIFQKAGYDTSLVGKAHFQPTASKPEYTSIECMPTVRDLDFWRKFHGPWYGFETVETTRMHGDEAKVGGHYAVWMEDQGLKNWRDYFLPWPHQKDYQRTYYSPKNRAWSLPEKFHYTTWTAERTIAQLERAAANDKPFFCWSSFHDPHFPYLVPEPWANMYKPENMPIGRLTPGEHEKNPIHFGLTQLPRDQAGARFQELFEEGQWNPGFNTHLQSEEALRKDMACYYGMVSFIDHQIGRIFRKLEELGQAQNTLVVFSTDHGMFIGQHGLTTKGPFHYEDLIRLPFIVRWPGVTAQGARSVAIQNLVDLAPTFLGACGLPVPMAMTGVNQVSSWKGDKPVRTWSITENHQSPTKVHLRTYVDSRYKITMYRTGKDGELFDLQEDPGELRNLWHEPAAAAIKRELLHRFMQATLEYEWTPMPRIAGA